MKDQKLRDALVRTGVVSVNIHTPLVSPWDVAVYEAEGRINSILKQLADVMGYEISDGPALVKIKQNNHRGERDNG